MSGQATTNGRWRHALRGALRFAGNVFAVSGVLLLVDVALTLTWQEPLSFLLATRSQSALERQLDKVLAAPVGTPAMAGRGAHRAKALAFTAARYRRALRTGRAVGRIELPSLGRRYVVVHGTDAATLRKGPAHYPETPLPGEGGTVAIAVHRTTYLAPFRTIDRLRPSEPIIVTVPYGRFTYRVERTRIVPPDALWVTRRVGYDRLILTACHPLYSAAKRIVVFAKLARVDPAG